MFGPYFVSTAIIGRKRGYITANIHYLICAGSGRGELINIVVRRKLWRNHFYLKGVIGPIDAVYSKIHRLGRGDISFSTTTGVKYNGDGKELEFDKFSHGNKVKLIFLWLLGY